MLVDERSFAIYPTKLWSFCPGTPVSFDNSDSHPSFIESDCNHRGEDPSVVMFPTSQPETQNLQPAFHILAKPTGSICNLDCKYCYFLSKEMLYPGSEFRMADEMLEAYIRQTIQAHQSPEIVIAWQGGEPTLMGLDFFRRSIARCSTMSGANFSETTDS
jgi:hypothetical protein